MNLVKVLLCKHNTRHKIERRGSPECRIQGSAVSVTALKITCLDPYCLSTILNDTDIWPLRRSCIVPFQGSPCPYRRSCIANKAARSSGDQDAQTESMTTTKHVHSELAGLSDPRMSKQAVQEGSRAKSLEPCMCIIDFMCSRGVTLTVGLSGSVVPEQRCVFSSCVSSISTEEFQLRNS